MTSLLRHNFRLSYVDFPPNCSSSDDALCCPHYEKFYSLIGRANEWLRDHPGLKVVTCETIKVKVHTSGKVVTSRSCYFKYDQTKKRFRNVYVKALRLWVTPHKDDESVVQQVGYVNLVPSRSVQTPFDSISETIVRFNDYLKVHPIPGEVLNIETDELKFHDLGFGGNDADECCWIESTLLSLTQLNFIRVYFHLGPPTLETIGCMDFLPSKVKRESKIDALVFEDFRSVVSMATAWVRQQQSTEPSLRVTNMQTIEYKLRTPSCHHHDHHHHHPYNNCSRNDADCPVEINSQQSYINNCNRHSNRSFRFLRLYFTRRIHSPATLPPSSGVTFTFDYMTFEPRLLSYGGIFGVPLFETLVQTMRRAMLWMEQLDADVDVLAAETIPVRLVPRSDVALKERMKMKMKMKMKKKKQTSKQNRREEDSDDDDCEDGFGGGDEDDDGRRWNDSVAMETDDETGVKWILGEGKNEFCLFLLRFYFNVDLSKLKRRRVDLSPAFQSDSSTVVENAGTATSAERPFYPSSTTNYECVLL